MEIGQLRGKYILDVSLGENMSRSKWNEVVNDYEYYLLKRIEKCMKEEILEHNKNDGNE
jgi:hypothetical protein